ncbi:biotin-dependent carboxyltransferase family protein [Porticoccus sp. W117]|uniref:5-oxoprolinase subunit C family protein n=1 Tax=Porticoccus sp. W117 TaxID=3054777 RepID=UPI00259558AE|nr:biotin-dependent carboxyltransferase family protein [Porticoccus sp. W117]MDM3870101.1 biotin-dependent carboxyltransferase family protein [Porticoccus sp. W117]
MLATVQDRGRLGSQHLGIGVGGPMDAHAFAWGNRLLENCADAAQIEVCFGNFHARFAATTWIALTGADLGWRLDGKPLVPWASYRVRPGSELRAGIASTGVRGYLAVAGGWQLPKVFGSCATVMGDRLGGLRGGERVQAGDQIACDSWDNRSATFGGYQVPEKFIPEFGAAITLRVLPGNQFEQFSQQSRQQFFAQDYQLSNRCDRMGCRMDGEPMTDVPGSMVSEAVPLGAIQVPSDGLPIVLLNDRQTIGGYPKLGSVYQVDLPKLAQARPGDRVRFVEGDLEEAQRELREFKQFFAVPLV